MTHFQVLNFTFFPPIAKIFKKMVLTNTIVAIQIQGLDVYN